MTIHNIKLTAPWDPKQARIALQERKFEMFHECHHNTIGSMSSRCITIE